MSFSKSFPRRYKYNKRKDVWIYITLLPENSRIKSNSKPLDQYCFQITPRSLMTWEITQDRDISERLFSRTPYQCSAAGLPSYIYSSIMPLLGIQIACHVELLQMFPFHFDYFLLHRIYRIDSQFFQCCSNALSYGIPPTCRAKQKCIHIQSFSSVNLHVPTHRDRHTVTRPRPLRHCYGRMFGLIH